MTIAVALFDDVEAVARDAAGALDRAAQPSLHDRIGWLRLMAAHGLGGRPLIVRADDGGGRSWLFLSQAGRRLEAFACWYTLCWRPVEAGGGDPAARLAAIAAALRGRGSRITLAPLLPGDAARTAAAFAGAGWIVERDETSANRRTVVAASGFESWWAARPARLRNTVARKERAAGLRIDLLDRFEGGAWAAYEEVYAASWKPPEGAPAFLRALAEQEGAAGTLRMGIAHAGGRPVAAQLWLSEGGTATIHKLAHRRDADALSPGTILTAAMARFVIGRDAVRTIDFGTGDDGYKADWMEQRRPLETLTLSVPLTLDGIRAAGRVLVRRVRSV